MRHCKPDEQLGGGAQRTKGQVSRSRWDLNWTMKNDKSSDRSGMGEGHAQQGAGARAWRSDGMTRLGSCEEFVVAGEQRMDEKSSQCS